MLPGYHSALWDILVHCKDFAIETTHKMADFLIIALTTQLGSWLRRTHSFLTSEICMYIIRVFLGFFFSLSFRKTIVCAGWHVCMALCSLLFLLVFLWLVSRPFYLKFWNNQQTQTLYEVVCLESCWPCRRREYSLWIVTLWHYFPSDVG